jgi:DNA polymerase
VRNVAHVDFETFNKINLKNVGVYRYSEDPSLEILVTGFAINNEPPEIWIPTNPDQKIKTEVFMRVGVKIHWGKSCPDKLLRKNVDHYRAHNCQFERLVGNSPAGQSIGFPTTGVDDWVCTAAKSAAHGLPRALVNVCKALDTEHQKDETNKSSMLKLCKPRKPSKKDKRIRWTYENAFDNYIMMYKYNVDDVLAERDVDLAVADLPPGEERLFQIDQHINARGWQIDPDAIGNALYLIADYKSRISANCIKLTGVKPTQREKLVEWIRDRGVDMDDMQAPTIRDHLKVEQDVKVRRALRIYQSYGMKAPSKYAKMLEAACSDDRLRGMFMYYGAGTGRWSSLIVQLQNLFRSLINDPNNAIAAMDELDLEYLMMLFEEDPMLIFASCVRGMLVPAKGKILRCADYNSIEGRFTSWLAGQEDKLEIYRTHGKVYEHTAAQIFQMPDDLESLLRMKKDHPDERFAGKTSELALGFQGAVDALNRMARKEGKEFDTEFALKIVRSWRKANSKIQQLWRNLEDYAVAAVENPGKIYETNRLMFKVEGDYLYMRLPSGRRLAYYKPQLRPGKYGEQVSYMGVDTQTRQWKRVRTYGGRLTENAAQAGSRDVMAHGLVGLDRAGYYVIGTVHDEVIDEDSEVNPHGSLEEMCEIMCDLPDWAEGLPVAADGWEGYRYKKD